MPRAHRLPAKEGLPLNRTLRRAVIALATALVLASPSVLRAADVPQLASRPNILFIMVDEMKWNVMGCAGHRIVKTPTLSGRASEATRFVTAYPLAPICPRPRYSSSTGCNGHVHGSTDNATPTREPQLLLPAIL